MKSLKKYPTHFYFGIVILLLAWFFNWYLTGLRTHLLFFPLWLGYSLTVDGIVWHRKGSSLLTRGFKKYLMLFLISIPVWWFFELLNNVTSNWHYLGRDSFSDFEYFVYASINFSTVIPAVFGSAELAGTFKWIKNMGPGPRISSGKNSTILLIIIGMIMMALLLSKPSIFYIFLWLSLFFILDSINHLFGIRSLVSYTNNKNWKPLVSLAIGCLICGFFWEMWNFYAYPKWIYHTPGVEFLYVFEMPLLGYLGYIPFSFELFAFYHLFSRVRSGVESEYYIQLVDPLISKSVDG